MPRYRICMFGKDGQAITEHVAECADDTDASALASRLLTPGTSAETWQGDRSLGRVSAPPLRQAPPAHGNRPRKP